MKTFLLAAFFALSLFDVSAQTKVGYISLDNLIGSMPEAVKAEAELRQFQEELGTQYQELVRDFNAKDSIFSADSLKMSASLKNIKREDLFKLYQRLQGWQEEGQQRYQAELQAKLVPIREKAMVAIKAVAKEAGYTHVMEEENLLVAPPADDLMTLVRKKLNITMPVKAPGAK